MAVIKPSPLYFNANAATAMVADAQQWVYEGRKNDQGCVCPTCGQLCKNYNRKLNASCARYLSLAYYWHRHEPFHLPDFRVERGLKQGDETKLAHWGLMVSTGIEREDGGKAGWWRVTEKGRRWIYREIVVPESVEIYNGQVLGFDETTMITVDQAFGNHHELDKLMGWIRT